MRDSRTRNREVAELLARAASAAARELSSLRRSEQLKAELQREEALGSAARSDKIGAINTAISKGVSGDALCVATTCKSKNAMQVAAHRARQRQFDARRGRLRVESVEVESRGAGTERPDYRRPGE